MCPDSVLDRKRRCKAVGSRGLEGCADRQNSFVLKRGWVWIFLRRASRRFALPPVSGLRSLWCRSAIVHWPGPHHAPCAVGPASGPNDEGILDALSPGSCRINGSQLDNRRCPVGSPEIINPLGWKVVYFDVSKFFILTLLLLWKFFPHFFNSSNFFQILGLLCRGYLMV